MYFIVIQIVIQTKYHCGKKSACFTRVIAVLNYDEYTVVCIDNIAGQTNILLKHCHCDIYLLTTQSPFSIYTIVGISYAMRGQPS